MTIMVEDTNTDSADQIFRADQREDYLTMLKVLRGTPAKVRMYENVLISGVYKASDPKGGKIFIADAELPMGGTLPAALLRTSDIISVHFSV